MYAVTTVTLERTAKMSSLKRKMLSLEDRAKVVERLLQGESARSVPQSLNVGKTQVQTIAKEKDDSLRRWRDGENGNGKCAKKRKCMYEDMNAAVWDWFNAMPIHAIFPYPT